MNSYVLRVKRDRRYKTVSVEACESDSSLSWKAIGILWYLLSRPDGWIFYESDLISRHSDGRDAVRAGLRELKLSGYLRRRTTRDEAGQFSRQVWWISESPLDAEEWKALLEEEARKAGIWSGIYP